MMSGDRMILTQSKPLRLLTLFLFYFTQGFPVGLFFYACACMDGSERSERGGNRIGRGHGGAAVVAQTGERFPDRPLYLPADGEAAGMDHSRTDRRRA